MRSSSCPVAPKSRKKVFEATYLRIHLWTDRTFVWHLATKERKEWQIIRPLGKYLDD